MHELVQYYIVKFRIGPRRKHQTEVDMVCPCVAAAPSCVHVPYRPAIASEACAPLYLGQPCSDPSLEVGTPGFLLSRVRRLAVELSLVENDLAKRGPVTVYLRVKDPDGNLLLDGTNASFTLAGEAVAATASREVDYEGAEVDMIIYVNDIPQFEKGVYTIEVYSEAGLLGETELVLR